MLSQIFMERIPRIQMNVIGSGIQPCPHGRRTLQLIQGIQDAGPLPLPTEDSSYQAGLYYSDLAWAICSTKLRIVLLIAGFGSCA
jgi:hypothetical protein